MQHLKLIKLLKILTKEEFSRLGKFLRSPFFNNTTSLITFYEILKKAYPEFAEKKLKPETIWLKIFPEKSFNQIKFLRLCSDLSLMIEKYLVQLELEQPKPTAEHLLIQSLSRRNAYKMYEKAVTSRLEDTENEAIRDANWYRERLILREDWFNHPLKNKYAPKDSILEDMLDDLDMSFTLQKLKLANNLKSKKRIYPNDYEIRYLETVKNANLSHENILIQFYILALELLENQTESFNKFEKLLFQNFKKIANKDCLTFFYSGLNFAIRRLNIGETNYSKVILNWYQFGIEKKLFINNQQMSQLTFRNIVLSFARENEFEWGEEFILQHSKYLKKEEREYLLNYNKGVLFFYRKDLDKAIHYLSAEKWPAVAYQLLAKNILIRAIFEKFLLDKDYYRLLNSQIDAFEIYLIRNKEINSKNAKPQLNLIRLLRSIANKKLRNISSKEINTWLDAQLEKRKEIISKNWLIKTLGM